MNLEDLSRDELIRLVRVHAKNWLAHDGCWFLALEREFGMDTAIEMDRRAWACFSPIEARRIVKEFGIGDGDGLDALALALGYRLYAVVNRQEAERVDRDTLRFRMVECRVQQARQSKGLPPFECQPVGLVEYAEFARAVDPSLEVTCVHAPPDAVGDAYCEWEFRVRR